MIFTYSSVLKVIVTWVLQYTSKLSPFVTFIIYLSPLNAYQLLVSGKK